MKNIITFKLIASLITLGYLVSCNQSTRNNNTVNSAIDTVEIAGMNKARVDETKTNVQREFDYISNRLDRLDENDPEFNTKLRMELDRLNTNFDTLEYRFSQNNTYYDDDLRNRYDSVRTKSNNLDDKLKRWSEKTGENLEELGNEIKREFGELKESLRNDR